MAIRSTTVLTDVIDNPDYNRGEYQGVHVEPLEGTALFSASVRAVNRWNRSMLLGWGYATTEAEAQELGESILLIAQMRYDLIKEHRDDHARSY